MVCSHELIPSVNQSAAVQHMAWCRRPVNMKCKSAPCATHTPDMQQAAAAATVAADSTATLVDFLAQCARTPVSRSPFSTLSLPCTMLRPTSMAKSPRIVPGSAARGLVAPISLRADATTPAPSHTYLTGCSTQRRSRGRRGRRTLTQFVAGSVHTGGAQSRQLLEWAASKQGGAEADCMCGN